MKMIKHNHFICHYYYVFSVFSHCLYMTFLKKSDGLFWFWL